MAESLSFSDIVEGKSTHLSLNVAAGKSIDIAKDNRDVNLIKPAMPSNFGAKVCIIPITQKIVPRMMIQHHSVIIYTTWNDI